MKHSIYIIALVSSFCTLGIALPQCSQTEEQKKQSLKLEATQQEILKKVSAFESELKDISVEVNRVKLLIPEMTHVMEGQKKDLEDLKAQLQEHIQLLKQVEAQIAAGSGNKKLPVKKK